MRNVRGWALCVLVACAGCGAPQENVVVRDRDPEPVAEPEPELAVPAGGRLPRTVVPTRYTLALDIDPRTEDFRGTAEIDVTLAEPTRVVYLHGKALRVSESTLTPEGAEPIAASWRTVDEESGFAALVLEREAPAGTARITIRYDAPFDRTLDGLYRVEGSGGHHYAFTQMEPLAARKAFPCFDEPGWKTPFEVTLVVAEGDTAIANAPEVTSEVEGGRRRVRFAPTEPLPTYLVAFAVGPLDVVEAPAIAANDIRDRPIPLRGVAPRGQGEHLAYALEHTPAILLALERYFGIPYPYGKLDIIAVPDFSAGAMENAGAITFRDQLLLVRGESAPARQRRGFAYVMAHEVAHQWFGNLVTMAWWDDLWLNEAFATWMETRTIAEVFPEHRPQISEVNTLMEAMDADSLSSARQIRQPIETDHDIHNAFDEITYSKGAAVLAMFERWIGPEPFRRGVQRYLREHPHGNATSFDLFAALSMEASRDVSLPFGTFVDQTGVPQIEVTPSCADGRGRLALRQARYVPSGSRAEGERRWQIPICVRYGVGREAHTECTVLEQMEGALELAHGCPSWVMPNAEWAGYYRFTLPPESIAALRRAPLTPRETIAYADSIQSSFESGRTSFADALAALEPLAANEERSIARSPMALYELAIERMLEGEAIDRARARARRTSRAQARRLGWHPISTESPDQQLWRAELLAFLAFVAEDPEVRREAARLGRAYLVPSDRGVDRERVPADLAELAVSVAAQEDGAPFFEQLLGILTISSDPIVRSNIVRGLASARDPELRRRALELTIDSRLRVSEAWRPLMAQFEDPQGVEPAWAWLGEHYDAVATRLGPQGAGYLPYAATGFCASERVEPVRAFFAPRVGATSGGPRNLEAALEIVELCAARAAHGRESAREVFAR
jgi:alanyl aminopeptidase